MTRLSPLVFEHINLLGRYAFFVPEAVMRDELEPLRNLAGALEEVAMKVLIPVFCRIARQDPS